MKLSIIIPVYNVERYLRSSLDSLLAQTFKDWEAICVDDGSTDSSGSILDEYAEHDNRIKVVHQANAKVHAARNNALDLAQGEWIGFFDPDDIIAPRWLEIAMSQTGEADMVRLEYTHGRDVHWCDLQENPFKLYVDGDKVREWGWNTFARSGFLWLCFIRKSSINNLRFKGGINCKEDGIFLLELLRTVKRVVQVKYPGYFYREVGGSLSNNKKTHVLQVISYLRALIDVYRQDELVLKELHLSDQVADLISWNAISDICSWALKLDWSEHKSFCEVHRAWELAKSTLGLTGLQYKNLTTRVKVPFKFWDATGCVVPLSLASKLYLKAGNILRSLGLRKRV